MPPKPNTTWYYFARDTNTLRHGHAYTNNLEKIQWHPAHMRHSDTDAHTVARSWNLQVALEHWSQKPDQYTLTDHEKREMILRAQAQHDGRRYVPDTPMPTVAPEASYTDPEPDEAPPAAPPAPAPAPTSTGDDDDDLVEMLTELPGRVSSLEQRASTIEATVQEQARHLATTRGALSEVDSRITTLQRDVTNSVGDLKEQVRTIEQRVPRPIEITVHVGDTTFTAPPGTYHQEFQNMLDILAANDPVDRNIWLVGPAGSSKTTSVRMMAQILNLKCYIQPSVMRAHELLGFFNTSGYQTTWFREAYEHGGVILLDEIDRSDARALVVLNGALSGDEISFPDAVVKRHRNCIVGAAANTYGQGADQQYVGAMKQDAAFLDRFLFVEWPYDEAFERAITPNLEWTDIVQKVRAAAFANRAKMIISPRASIKGGNMLNRGISRQLTVRTIFGQYLKHNMWPTIGAAAIEWAKHEPAKRTTLPVTSQTPTYTPEALAPGANGALKHMDFSSARVFGTTR